MESASSVCIRFVQLRAPQQNAGATKTRQHIRSQLVEVLNKIQQVCGTDNAPFAVTDVSYIAFVNMGKQAGGYHYHSEAGKGDATSP
jgi:thiamine monophosphate synthase